MGKITVKHYLNTNLKPTIVDNGKQYPIYVQVFVNAKSLKFKSNNNLFKMLSDSGFNNSMVQSILSEELNLVENIVNYLQDNDMDKLITSKNIALYSTNLIDVIDKKLSNFVFKESKENKFDIPDIFEHLKYKDVEELNWFYMDHRFEDISSNCRYIFGFLSWYSTCDFYEKNFCVFDILYGDRHEEFIDMINIHNKPNENNELLDIFSKFILE